MSSSVICNELWNKGVLASVRSWLLFFCFKLCILFRRCANSETLSLTLLGTDACACVSRLMVCVNCSFVLLIKSCLKQQIRAFIRHGFLVAFAIAKSDGAFYGFTALIDELDEAIILCMAANTRCRYKQ